MKAERIMRQHPYENVLKELNEKLWDYSEIKFEEYRSMAAITEILREGGFEVKTGLAGMPTAFKATYGSGRPVIGILGEYDALSGMSQEADCLEHKERADTSCGHGCGHCQLGTGSVGAVLQIRDYLCSSKKSGTVIFFGCPAEEGGSGKAFMARDGVFDELDIALTWHPGNANCVVTGSYQANCQAYFRFKGVSSHAAASPHLGRSALDAVELMDVGANYLREHMEPTDRIHYAVLDTGGISPNVVQAKAEVVYLIRSVTTEKAAALYNRILKIAQGAALMTETELEVIFDKACSNLVSNSVLEQLLYEKMQEVGVPEYSREELEYAAAYKATTTEQDLEGDQPLMFQTAKKKKLLLSKMREKNIADFIVDYEHLDIDLPGSSDVGDVSHVVPTAQFLAVCSAVGTPAHSWQRVAQGKSSLALKGILFAADVLAKAAKELYEKPQLVEAAKEEFLELTGGAGYECPIPADVRPNQRKAEADGRQ